MFRYKRAGLIVGINQLRHVHADQTSQLLRAAARWSRSRRVRCVKLTRVHIQAYRSLYDVTLVPTAFTVLVGPNNAGKTNLADSLEFLGQVARNGLEVAVSREGGYENLAFRRARRTRKPVEFKVTSVMSGQELSYPLTGPAQSRARSWDDFSVEIDYAFALRASSESRDADFRVTSEILTMRVTAPRATADVSLSRRESRVQITYGVEPGPAADKDASDQMERILDPFNIDSFGDYLENTLAPTELVLNRLSFNGVIRDWLTELGRTRLFQLTPVECRLPGSATPNPELERHGRNLPAVVRYMQRNHTDAWQETLQAMRGIMPGLTAIETEFTTNRRLALLFHEKGARAWTSDEVSDGTIQSLALFTCLFDPRVPLALIEEPENSVHPWIVKMFVDACRSASAKQVLVTTHSPALISYLKPAEVDIVWRDGEGRTKISALEQLDPQAAELWESGKLDLYELIDGGWIRQSVPPGLQ